MDALGLLQQWYLSQCDGDWEHSWGVKISTLDNPGWSVDINLDETELESRVFNAINKERGEDDWIVCRVKEKVFEGRGGPLNLEEIINVFLRWAKEIPQ